jgi:tetratricopeptide (TPR) repeat protein
LSAAFTNKGATLAKLGRYEDEIAAWDQALAIKPDKHEAFYNKACCYALQGQLALALDGLQRAIRLDGSWQAKAMTDSDFDAILSEPGFQALMAPGE